MPKYTCIQEWTNLITHKVENLEDTDVSHLVLNSLLGRSQDSSLIYGAVHWYGFHRLTAPCSTLGETQQ